MQGKAGNQTPATVKVKCIEIHSNVTDDPFVIFYLNSKSSPPMHTLTKVQTDWHSFEMSSDTGSAALVGQMYFERPNDDRKRVSQYLGSVVIDLSHLQDLREYKFELKDFSDERCVGEVTVSVQLPHIKLQPIHKDHRQELYSAAQANLTWIKEFSPEGLPSIIDGLKYVHAPYYVNHLGVTLPAGAFCMIPTTLEDNFSKAVRSHKQRIIVALARNCLDSQTWKESILNLLKEPFNSKHIRSLVVIADAVTLHAKLDTFYTPDVEIMDDGSSKGTERWSVPREPSKNGGLSYTGDCEDFAREVYQQCKEIREWIKPGTGSLMELVSAVHHMYVPTIEQGAVNSEAHSIYVTDEAAYRNHIWAALHPRHAWKTKMLGKISVESLYKQWPLHKCERHLPLLHLEGTGDVYPVVRSECPTFIGKMIQKTEQVQMECPFIRGADAVDMSLQSKTENVFYKYPIAFMTDIFKSDGILDYTYITDDVYGVSMASWIRGQYRFKPSTTHSPKIMKYIENMIRMERPIFALTNDSSITKRANVQEQNYYVRFGQREPFSDNAYNIARYKIDQHEWNEMYFSVDK